MSSWPRYGFKTTHGRTLEAVEPASQATAKENERVWVCVRRLHVFTLPTTECPRCKSGDWPSDMVRVDRFRSDQ